MPCCQSHLLVQSFDIVNEKFDTSINSGSLITAEYALEQGKDVFAIPGPIDIGFIDAFEKRLSQNYFDLLWPKISVGGSIVVDNTGTHAEELADYVRYARSRSDASSVGIPVGNGFEWTIKLR